MLHYQLVLLFYKGKVKYFSVQNICRKLLIVFPGIMIVWSIFSTTQSFLKKRALQNEITLLNLEFNWKSREFDRLKKNYDRITQNYNEVNNMKRVIKAINPQLEDKSIVLWVKTLRLCAEELSRNLNNQSFFKLELLHSHYSLNPGVALLLAVAAMESDFNLRLRSSKGAYGPMQLKKSTAQSIGVIDLYDPEENIIGGAKYMGILLNRFYGYPNQLEFALASYNAGITRVTKEWIPKWGSQWQNINSGLVMNGGSFRETRIYVKSILALAHLFVSGKWSTRDQLFWENYKQYLRNYEDAILYADDNYLKDF